MPICENITYTEYIKRACFIEEQMQNHSQLHSPPHFKKASYASLHLMLDLTESRRDTGRLWNIYDYQSDKSKAHLRYDLTVSWSWYAIEEASREMEEHSSISTQRSISTGEK